MNPLNISIYLVRTVMIILSVFYICKRDLKTIIFTISVFALTFIPAFLDLMFDINVDIFAGILYTACVFMAVYLGNALGFYDKYFWWDILAHFLFGVVFVNFAIAFVKKIEFLDKFNILLISFAIAVTLQTLWEVLEFIADRIFHANNQRWKGDNKKDVQPAGLVDTMNDTIYFIIGSLITCFVWWSIL